MYQSDEEKVDNKVTTNKQQTDNKVTHTRIIKNIKKNKNIYGHTKNTREYSEEFFDNLINFNEAEVN